MSSPRKSRSADMREVRRRLGRSPYFQAGQDALRHKVKALSNDREFFFETYKVKDSLTAAFERTPEAIASFFTPVFRPRITRRNAVASRIARLKGKELKQVLERYVRYVFRFGVVMRLHKKKPHFRPEVIDPEFEAKYHAWVVNNNLNLVPAGTTWWDKQTPIEALFGSRSVHVGPRLEELIGAGHAKYVLIDDAQQRSLFTQLVDFAYSHDRLTFVVLNAGHPCVMCLIGENVSVDKVWHQAGKAVAELQRDKYGRTKVGRKPKLGNIKKKINVLRRPGPLKVKAAELARNETDRSVYSAASALSQLRRKLRP